MSNALLMHIVNCRQNLFDNHGGFTLTEKPTFFDIVK